MQREIGGNIPLSEESLCIEPTDREIFGCSKFKYNLYTFSARSALNVFLDEIYTGRKKVLLPIFTCSTCIKPFIDHGFQIDYYRINTDFSVNEESLANKLENISYEGILYIHSYFGFDTLKSIKPLLKELRKKESLVIIDDYTQSWLNDKKEIEADYYLASIRKWLPTPDGGVLSSDTNKLNSERIRPYCKKQVDEYITASLLKNRFLSGDESIDKSQFYPLFKHTIEFFEKDCAYALSPVSKVIYDTADYKTVITKRIQNAEYLCNHINNKYIQKIFTSIPKGVVPFYYPIYVKNGKRAEFQKYLIQKNIFCTIHWTPSSYIEGMEETKTIFPEILSLVCDQRYDLDDMENFVAIINHFQQ